MKYQRSSIPYLTLLFVLLFGLPILDYKVENNLSVEVDIDSMSIEEIVPEFRKVRDRQFVTLSIQRPPQ